MKSVLIFLVMFLAFGATATFAQHGGKAEPLRIKFAAGKSSTTLTGTLSNDQQMEYIFGASKGQKVTILIPTQGFSIFGFLAMNTMSRPNSKARER